MRKLWWLLCLWSLHHSLRPSTTTTCRSRSSAESLPLSSSEPAPCTPSETSSSRTVVVVVLVDRDPGDEQAEDFANAAVVAQRMRRFRMLGYELGHALELAHHGCCPREVASLVERGCPLDVAARIVL